MKSTKVQVLLASEQPEIRRLVEYALRRELGGVEVVQAENAVKATALADSLRPKVVVVDAELPHMMGWEGVRLSRVGGLDTATSISQRLPGAVVILLSGQSFREEQWGREVYELCLHRDGGAKDTRVNLADLLSASSDGPTMVFGHVQAKALPSAYLKTIKVSEKAIEYSSIAIASGLGLMVTVIFIGPGAFLAMAGASMFLFGMGVRLTAGLWPKRFRAKPNESVS